MEEIFNRNTEFSPISGEKARYNINVTFTVKSMTPAESQGNLTWRGSGLPPEHRCACTYTNSFKLTLAAKQQVKSEKSSKETQWWLSHVKNSFILLKKKNK